MPDASEPTTSAAKSNATTGGADTDESSQSWRSRMHSIFRRRGPTHGDQKPSIGGLPYEEILSAEDQEVERRILELINESKASRAQGEDSDWAARVKTYLSSHKDKFKEVGKKAGETAMDEAIRKAIQSGFEQI